jgi:hypothetical protein
MQRLLLSFFLVCSIAVRADEFRDKHGNGVLHIQADSVFMYEFYSAPGSPVTHRLTLLRNAWSLDHHSYYFDTLKKFDTLPPWFTTLFFIPSGEYGRIDIAALDSSQGYYRTILKDEQGREVWVKKSNHTRFLTWFDFYATMSSIELISDALILYSGPTEKSKPTDYTTVIDDDRQWMTPMEIKDFWMKVEIRVPDNDPAKPDRVYSGWIQWRDENQPLIKYNLMGC